jgi:hypothetical protein
MKRHNPLLSVLSRSLFWAFVALLTLFSPLGVEAEEKPSITITHAPPDTLKAGSDSTGKIAGKVSGARVEVCKVVILTKRDKWEVQPRATAPHTDINPAGKWENQTRGGYRYAALLVKTSYTPPATMKKLPKVADDVLAIDIVPAITITNAPNIPPGPTGMGPIDGKVRGVNTEACQVVIFAFGDMWYVQPFANAPYTDINEDGTWDTHTHGGFQYAALLVTEAYKPPNTTSLLPKVDGKKVLAMTKVKPTKK